MTELAARAYYSMCLVVGRLLRSAGYSRIVIVDDREGRRVRKTRRRHAPALIWTGRLLFRVLNTGVRVLDAPAHAERERGLYAHLRGQHVGVEADGTLVLPFLSGRTLAAVLEDADLSISDHAAAIASAVDALVELHDLGYTHGDAMAENVMIDVARGAAHWLDFENAHESDRPVDWRRADDLRTLLTTCLVRTPRERVGAVVTLVLDGYGDERVVRILASTFASVRRRSLVFHLSQAPLSFRRFQEVRRLASLGAEVGTSRTCVPAGTV